MATLNLLLDTLLLRLAWTSAQAVLLIGAVWLIGRLLPQLSPGLRCTLWWLVGLQLMLGLCWASPLQLRVLAPATQARVAMESTAGETAATVQPTLTIVPIRVADVPRQARSSAWRSHWRELLLSLWLAALLVQLLVACGQWRQGRRLLRESQPLTDDALRVVCALQVRKLGLRRPPQLRVSHAIHSPQVTGLWRATVLLPADERLSHAESAMALAHELAHLRRGDLWLGWIPAIAQRLFFFHPLVAWAMREYALAREAACDAQVLHHTGTLPQAYGQLLLRLGISRPMHSGLAGASPSFHNLRRRLIMLQQSDNPSRRRARGWPLVMLVVLAGVLPYRVTASAPQNAPASTHAAPAAQVPPAPPMPPTTLSVPPPPPLPPPAPMPPPPPPPHSRSFSGHHVDIDTSTDAAHGFALLDGDSVTINGSDADVDAVHRLRKANEPMLWFRRGNKAYVVRDSAYIKRAKAIYAPVSELGQQQGALGGEQGRLGGQQGSLGARQGSLGMRQGQLAAEQARLAAEQAALALQPSDDKRQAEFEASQARLQASEDELARQQDELGRQQDELGKQQDALGAKQDALGRRQEQASAQAELQIGKLIDEALAKGVAQAVSPR